MKFFLKSIIPPILLTLYRRLKNPGNGWVGKYKTWSEAKKNSTGYDDKIIISKVRESMKAIKLGLAEYERDSVLFYEANYNWPLITSLLFSYSKNNYLSVIDFGGSLGSTYYQNKKYLSNLNNLKWGIVEQHSFFDVGKLEFENNNLRFYDSIEECNTKIEPNTLLLSGVLQYIEEPYVLLKKLLSHSYDTIILDRTPFVLGDEYITIQHVPPKIYNANYPCWFFNKQKMLNYFLSNKYELLNEFETVDGVTSKYEYKGLIFVKKA